MKSRIVRSRGVAWPEAVVRPYKDDPASFCEVERRVLLGAEAGDELSFELRYFDIAPGGWTTLEHHRHPHAVVIVAGRGVVRLGAERHEVSALDVVYVAPGEPHQFLAAEDQHLGILCVVDQQRDRPVPIEE